MDLWEGERRAVWAGGEIHLNLDPDAGAFGKRTWTVFWYSSIVGGKALRHDGNQTFGDYSLALAFFHHKADPYAVEIAEWGLGLSTEP